MTDKRVGLIGYGLSGGTFHAPLIGATPGLTLSVIVTANPERRRKAGQEQPDARLLGTVDEMWDLANELDLVVVASPNGMHVEHATSAINSGLSVVVDKPFATTALQARQLMDAARRRGLMIAPFHNRRWDGDFLTLRRLIDEGKLGRVLRFESRFERWRTVPKPRWTEPTAAASAEGIFLDLHTHLVDQALVLFGPVVDVYAEADRRHPDARVEDDAFIALTHASGVRSHLKATTAAAQIGPRMSVYGSRAAYVKLGVDPQEDVLKAGKRPGDPGWAEDSPELWGTLGDGETVSRVRTERGAYERYYAGIVEALRADGRPPVEPEDAAIGLAIIEAAHQSCTERRVVRLTE